MAGNLPHKILEQERAEFAWKKVKETGNLLDKYSSLVQKMPAMIMNAGLGQTLAFLVSKAGVKDGKVKREKEHGLLYNHLEEWLTDGAKNKMAPYTKELKEDSQAPLLLACIMNNGSHLYLRATTEALELIYWLRHFAKALETKDKSVGLEDVDSKR